MTVGGRTILSVALNIVFFVKLQTARKRLAIQESKSKSADKVAAPHGLMLLFQQLGEVSVVVEHGAVMHKFQDLMHFVPVLAIHVDEPDRDA